MQQIYWALRQKSKKIKNPRIEQEDHYYNLKNTSLIKLGLDPIKTRKRTCS